MNEDRDHQSGIRSSPKRLQSEKSVTRPCGFGRFAHIACDKQDNEQVFAQPSSAQELASIEPPVQQEEVLSSSPLALGDLPSIKKEMEALAAEVAQQHAELGADRAEIEQLERSRVRTRRRPSERARDATATA